MKELTPKQIVRELDKYIIGQSKAKKAVAIAMRNRWRRQQVDGYMRNEIMPNNIIMIGSTGVGKTEISRRLAALTSAPFVKVEASKFTEVGYVGRDVESMVRDLMDTSFNMVQREKEEEIIELAESLANERIIDILFTEKDSNNSTSTNEAEERHAKTRARLRKKLESGDFEETIIEIEIEQESLPGMQVLGPIGMDDFGMNIKDMLSNAIPKSKKPRKMPVTEARGVLIDAEAQKLIDNDEVIRIAKDKVENNGIIFIDEIDKVVNGNGGQGPDVSREGVQRDLLPIVEGSNVNTKYGVVSTDHILFIAAGAFHISTPSEMIPELQGRFPIRVELDKLKTKDFIKILTHPKSALIKQYVALLEAEGVVLEFEPSSIRAISELATEVNTKTENIGARRLHTIMTTLLEEPLYEHPKKGQTKLKITAKYVKEALGDIVFDEDLSRYIL